MKLGDLKKHYLQCKKEKFVINKNSPKEFSFQRNMFKNEDEFNYFY